MKCLKEIASVSISSCFTFTHSAHGRTTSSQCNNTLVVPSWNIAAIVNILFQYRDALLWNRRPVDVRSNFTDMSLNELKVLYKCFLLTDLFVFSFYVCQLDSCKYIL